MTPRILIIAGSDSGGGAGIQADIKTVTMLGGHAMTAVTAITAQNTVGVDAVHLVPTDIVIAQIDAVVRDIGVDAVKIGMIGSAETAGAVAAYFAAMMRGQAPSVTLRVPPPPEGEDLRSSPPGGGGGEADGGGLSTRTLPIVFDPVMVATSGATLADSATIAAFDRLAALAAVVTPNLPELAALGGEDRLARFAAVLIKGGHGEGDVLVDRLVTAGGELARWSGARIDTTSTHGTGCTLASAVAVGLAEGVPLVDAVARARRFVRAALERAPGLGQGHGPMGHQFVDRASLA